LEIIVYKITQKKMHFALKSGPQLYYYRYYRGRRHAANYMHGGLFRFYDPNRTLTLYFRNPAKLRYTTIIRPPTDL